MFNIFSQNTHISFTFAEFTAPNNWATDLHWEASGKLFLIWALRGQNNNTCSSVCISPQSHFRSSLGIRDHLPVSTRSLCEDKRSLVVATRAYSGTTQSLEYITLTLRFGFISQYVTLRVEGESWILACKASILTDTALRPFPLIKSV